MFVPVVDKNQKPLMPTKPSRARKWIRDKKATPFWKNGVFCVRLNVEPSDRYFQEIAVGVDPGSKKEGFTVKSETHTYFNVQADAHDKVGKKVEKRRELRRGRRSRKCPNRKNRTNRLANREGRQRSRQGGTVLGKGLVKNTLVKHVKYGLTRLSGINAKGLFSIYNLEGNQRLTTSAKQSDFRLLTRLNFNYRSGHSSSP